METGARSDAPSGYTRRLRAAIARYARWKPREITHLYARSLAGLIAPAPLAGWSIEVLGEDRVAELEAAWPFHHGEIVQRLRRQGRCYLAIIDGRIAHYSWIQTTGVHFIGSAGRWVRVRPGEIWIYHCRTFEWARGRGIYPAVLSRILWDYAVERFARALIYTTLENIASQRGILQAGFVPVHDYRSLMVGPLRLLWFGA